MSAYGVKGLWKRIDGVPPSQAPSEEQVLAAVREVGGLVYDNGAISFMRAEHFLAAVAALGVPGTFNDQGDKR